MPSYVYVKPTKEFGVITNSTHEQAAVRSSDGHSWWKWSDLVSITWAECVNRVKPDESRASIRP